jgi:hypothetical protein
MIVYKVVWNDSSSDVYYSCVAKGILQMKYIIGEETKLPAEFQNLDCGLMCFETLDLAKGWLDTVRSNSVDLRNKYYILECSASTPIGLPKVYVPFAGNLAYYRSFQNAKTDYDGELGVFTPPLGTLGFSSITPVRVIK